MGTWNRCFSQLNFLLLNVFILCLSPLTLTANDPNIYENPLLTERMRAMISPYLIPIDHPMKGVLDRLFAQGRVTESMQSLKEAGFDVIAAMPRSYVVVVRHPAVPGYVLKLYLDSETRMKENTPNWMWLTQRCIGANKIREIIKHQRIKNFIVPDKWIYVLPPLPASQGPSPQPILVIATDIEPFADAKLAWKTLVTREHLDELFIIMKWGYSTTQIANIPYTKSGKFAFMDTEYPCRNLHLIHIEKYLSKEMAKYWERMLEVNGGDF